MLSAGPSKALELLPRDKFPGLDTFGQAPLLQQVKTENLICFINLDLQLISRKLLT